MIATLLLWMSCSFPLNYAQIFGTDYQKALSFCIENKVLIEKKANQYQLPIDELMAIVFPELIRHSTFQDFFETKALSFAYVNSGKAAADFSIGFFQMKPSFVEALEVAIKNEDSLKELFENVINYPEDEAGKQRERRLKRLQDKAWQLDYLCCFYKLVALQFSHQLTDLTKKEQVQFFAAAYNAGFDQSFDAIQKWTTKAYFPYGTQYPSDQQYIYADIAWDYYKKKNS